MICMDRLELSNEGFRLVRTRIIAYFTEYQKRGRQ